jgi:CheY-like chemotaxis protein/HPt (histidine-containing phosphotransfer) domain-containing protein
MGGRIGVRSKLGTGSTFWFTARFEMGDREGIAEPIRGQAEVEEIFATYSQRSAISGRWSSLDRKVLVVDDNEVNLLVAQRMLEELGFEVDLAVNGQEAIDASAGYDYAAILIDSQMPGMDGNEATSIIRRSEGDEKHTPIIALTANALAPDREKAFAAGVDDYLSKPVFLEDLEGALGRLLASDGDAPIEVLAADLRQNGMSSGSVFDASIVEELRKIGGPGEPDLFSELAGQFLDQMPAWLNDIRSAASHGDAETVRRLAHKLLGLCRQIGAERIARVCDDLESIETDSADADMLREIELLYQEFDTAHRELQDRNLV